MRDYGADELINKRTDGGTPQGSPDSAVRVSKDNVATRTSPKS